MIDLLIIYLTFELSAQVWRQQLALEGQTSDQR